MEGYYYAALVCETCQTTSIMLAPMDIWDPEKLKTVPTPPCPECGSTTQVRHGHAQSPNDLDSVVVGEIVSMALAVPRANLPIPRQQQEVTDWTNF